jgi:pimeloyl-ACP methyl ester carboxylesterase
MGTTLRELARRWCRSAGGTTVADRDHLGAPSAALTVGCWYGRTTGGLEHGMKEWRNGWPIPALPGTHHDLAGVIEHLGLDRADLLGYSLGTGASLHTAIQHPERVRRLALVSIPFRR